MTDAELALRDKFLPVFASLEDYMKNQTRAIKAFSGLTSKSGQAAKTNLGVVLTNKEPILVNDREIGSTLVELAEPNPKINFATESLLENLNVTMSKQLEVLTALLNQSKEAGEETKVKEDFEKLKKSKDDFRAEDLAESGGIKRMTASLALGIGGILSRIPTAAIAVAAPVLGSILGDFSGYLAEDLGAGAAAPVLDSAATGAATGGLIGIALGKIFKRRLGGLFAVGGAIYSVIDNNLIGIGSTLEGIGIPAPVVEALELAIGVGIGALLTKGISKGMKTLREVRAASRVRPTSVPRVTRATPTAPKPSAPVSTAPTAPTAPKPSAPVSTAPTAPKPSAPVSTAPTAPKPNAPKPRVSTSIPKVSRIPATPKLSTPKMPPISTILPPGVSAPKSIFSRGADALRGVGENAKKGSVLSRIVTSGKMGISRGFAQGPRGLIASILLSTGAEFMPDIYNYVAETPGDKSTRKSTTEKETKQAIDYVFGNPERLAKSSLTEYQIQLIAKIERFRELITNKTATNSDEPFILGNDIKTTIGETLFKETLIPKIKGTETPSVRPMGNRVQPSLQPLKEKLKTVVMSAKTALQSAPLIINNAPVSAPMISNVSGGTRSSNMSVIGGYGSGKTSNPYGIPNGIE